MAVLGAGAALAITSATSTHNAASNTSTPIVPLTTTETVTQTEPTPSTTAPSTSPAGASEAETPVAALDGYWSDIENKEYSGAWAHETSHTGGEEAHWVHEEEGNGVSRVKYEFAQGSISGDEATVNVVHLVTHDQTYGCRYWTGSYGMLNEGGKWLISSANIEPHSCG